MAKVKTIKKKDHEKLTDSNVKHVMELLNADKPITKKSACEILNISYNTTRLNNIIESYIARKANDKIRREKNRGKPVTEGEVSTIISGYLQGETISDISKIIFRSASFVKGVIEKLGVPQKQLGDAKYETAILPDECVSQTFKPGQTVWSASYHAPCEVISEVISENLDYEKKYGCKAYRVYILEALDEVPQYFPRVTVGGFNAVSLACDLGSLEHLSKYNVNYTV